MLTAAGFGGDGLGGFIENVRDTLYNMSPGESLLDTTERQRGQYRYWNGLPTLCRFSELTHCRSASGTLKQGTKYRGDETIFVRETTFDVQVKFDCVWIAFGERKVKVGEIGQSRRSFFISIAENTAIRFLEEMQRLNFVPESPSAACKTNVFRLYMLIFDRLCGFGLLTATSVVGSFISDLSASKGSHLLRRSQTARALLSGKVHNVQLALEELSPSSSIVDMADRKRFHPSVWESTYCELYVTRVVHCQAVEATLRQSDKNLGVDTNWTLEVPASLMAGHDGLTLQVGDESIRMGEIGTSRQTLFESVTAQGGGWFVNRLWELGFIASSRNAKLAPATKTSVTRVFMRLLDELCGYSALTAVSILGSALAGNANTERRLVVAGATTSVTLVEISC